MELSKDSNGWIPRMYRRWLCPDPQTCPARTVSGHSPAYCPYGQEVDARDGAKGSKR